MTTSTARSRWAADYRAYRTASTLWSFMDPDLVLPGVPSFVQSSPRGDACRLWPDHLEVFPFLRLDGAAGRRLTHQVRMRRLSDRVRLPA